MNKKYGPWLIKKSISKYKNPWIEVIEDQVVNPSGQDTIFGVVKMKPGLSVLALDDANNVYLTREFHYALGDYNYEVVNGGIEPKENVLTAAKRELKEELGITAKTWISLGRTQPFTTAVKADMDQFLARNLKFGKAKNDKNEIIKLIKVPFTKAIKMVMNNQITHSPSALLILKAYFYLNSKI
jgi:ADP-ribose pyrophosphatase